MDAGNQLPLIRITADKAAETAIREAVRRTETIGGKDGPRLAQKSDAQELYALLKHPAVHAPIYMLPVPLTQRSVEQFIDDHLALRDAGEGLLFVRQSDRGVAIGYSDVQIWPQWATGELSGALHPDWQGDGRGGAGAGDVFDWMFNTLGLDRICATAALDNRRTAKLLDRLNFTEVGHITSTRPDGSERASRVWQIEKDDWRKPTAA